MQVHQITTKDGRSSAPQSSRVLQRSPERRRPTLGLIVGNRGFFPGHLVTEGREEMLRVLASEGIDVVALRIHRLF